VRRAFESGAFADRSFRALADRAGLQGRELAQAQRLAFGAVQRRGTSDAVVKRLSGRDGESLDGPVAAALRLGLYEILFADATPDHAAVDQAVELAKSEGAGRGTGFVNAVLRRAARERESLLGGLSDADPAAAAVAHSAPEWLARMWWRELGPDRARSMLAAANAPAETAMRVNRLRLDANEARARLANAGVDAAPAAGPAPLDAAPLLAFSGRIGEETISMVREGHLTPQSRASAAVVELLDPRPGERILDLCGGPGIKATQIAERMGDEGEVVSVEPDERRCAEIAENAERVGGSCIRAVRGDGRTTDLRGPFDRVLVDAPCSDLGTLASRPDARWRKSEKAIAELAGLQSDLLARALALVRPGGTVVYSTCTISRRENEELVGPAAGLEDLGALYPALVSATDPRCLQVRPDRDRTTGFFIARFRLPEGG
jgi:16S rRNA (cytosine967-C5)-methyltransferase